MKLAAKPLEFREAINVNLERKIQQLDPLKIKSFHFGKTNRTWWSLCRNLEVHKHGWWSKYSTNNRFKNKLTFVCLFIWKKLFALRPLDLYMLMLNKIYSLSWILSKSKATSFGINGASCSSKICSTRSSSKSSDSRRRPVNGGRHTYFLEKENFRANIKRLTFVWVVNWFIRQCLRNL